MTLHNHNHNHDAAANAALSDMRKFVQENKRKIEFLEQINTSVIHRMETKTNIIALTDKFKKIQKNEKDRCEKYDQHQKSMLMDLEKRGDELCSDHAKLLHQIEHIQWHLDHKPNHCQPDKHCSSPAPPTNCRLSLNKSHETISLVNTSEHLIKSLADLRRKIHIMKDKLDKETKEKRFTEKKIANMRKDISLQKKYISSSKRFQSEPPPCKFAH